MPDPGTFRITIGEADFRRLCAGRTVRLVTLGEHPFELTLAEIDVVRKMRAVLDGTLPPGLAERRPPEDR